MCQQCHQFIIGAYLFREQTRAITYNRKYIPSAKLYAFVFIYCFHCRQYIYIFYYFRFSSSMDLDTFIHLHIYIYNRIFSAPSSFHIHCRESWPLGSLKSTLPTSFITRPRTWYREGTQKSVSPKSDSPGQTSGTDRSIRLETRAALISPWLGWTEGAKSRPPPPLCIV